MCRRIPVALTVLVSSAISAQTLNFTGPFAPGNWTGTKFTFIGDSTLSIQAGGYAQLASPAAGTVGFAFSGMGNFYNGSATSNFSGGGKRQVYVPQAGNLMRFGTGTTSLFVSQFSFTPGGSTGITSDLSVSESVMNIGALANGEASRSALIRNFGPQDTTYSVVGSGTTSPAISIHSGESGAIAANGSTQFVVRGSTTQAGDFISQYTVSNLGDPNDQIDTGDNAFSVNLHVNNPPKPSVYLPLHGPASATTFIDTTIDQGDGPVKTREVMLHNAPNGSLTAGAKLLKETLSWSAFTRTTFGTTMFAAGDSLSRTFTFDSTGKLNGTYVATYTATWNNGLAAGTSVTITDPTQYQTQVQLTAVVTGNASGNGSTPVDLGTDWSGFNIQGAPSGSQVAPTHAQLLEGSSTHSGTLSVSIEPLSSEQTTGFGEASAVSNVVRVNGTGADPFVLQVSYDEAALVPGAVESELFLAWWNGTAWVNAVEGNTGNSDLSGSSPFLSSYGDFRGGHAGSLDSIMGAFGVDTGANVVWAVLNHNSDFTTFPSIPEPVGAMSIASMLLLTARHRRK